MPNEIICISDDEKIMHGIPHANTLAVGYTFRKLSPKIIESVIGINKNGIILCDTPGICTMIETLKDFAISSQSNVDCLES
jgi:hypothetical protein